MTDLITAMRQSYSAADALLGEATALRGQSVSRTVAASLFTRLCDQLHDRGNEATLASWLDWHETNEWQNCDVRATCAAHNLTLAAGGATIAQGLTCMATLSAKLQAMADRLDRAFGGTLSGIGAEDGEWNA